jgi:hypothetical protein
MSYIENRRRSVLHEGCNGFGWFSLSFIMKPISVQLVERVEQTLRIISEETYHFIEDKIPHTCVYQQKIQLFIDVWIEENSYYSSKRSTNYSKDITEIE